MKLTPFQNLLPWLAAACLVSPAFAQDAGAPQPGHAETVVVTSLKGLVFLTGSAAFQESE